MNNETTPDKIEELKEAMKSIINSNDWGWVEKLIDDSCSIGKAEGETILGAKLEKLRLEWVGIAESAERSRIVGVIDEMSVSITPNGIVCKPHYEAFQQLKKEIGG